MIEFLWNEGTYAKLTISGVRIKLLQNKISSFEAQKNTVKFMESTGFLVLENFEIYIATKLLSSGARRYSQNLRGVPCLREI